LKIIFYIVSKAPLNSGNVDESIAQISKIYIILNAYLKSPCNMLSSLSKGHGIQAFEI